MSAPSGTTAREPAASPAAGAMREEPMPTRDEVWPAGTPCWVDCQVDDPKAAAELYAALFGWQIDDPGPDAGGYLMASRDGRAVAGIGPKPDRSGGMPSAWTTYLATDDADATAAAITQAGGQVFMPPFDVMDAGRMSVAADSVGAVFGLWQAQMHRGVGIFNEPGTLCWNELHTKGYAESQQFYTSVFGWSFDEIGGGGFTYSTFKGATDAESIGGVHLDEQLAEGHPPYWLVWFAVGNCDDAVGKATALGASVLMPAMDSPFGRMSVVRAPQGEAFGVIDVATRVGEAAGS